MWVKGLSIPRRVAEGREVDLSLPFAGGLCTAPSGIKGRFALHLHPFLLALRAVRAAALDGPLDSTGALSRAELNLRQ